MRVLKVIDTLSVGGAEKVFIDLTNLLHENGVDVSALFILTPGVWAKHLHSDIPQHVLNRTWKWSPYTMYRCARILKQYDIIHCHHRYIYVYIALCATLFGVSSKVILHDHINKEMPSSIINLMKPKYFIGVSSELTSRAVNYLGMIPNHVYLLPNIVRPCKVNIPESKLFDWVLVSNIKPLKNQLFAIELAKHMHQSLMLIGKIQDTSYHQQLLQAIKGHESHIEIRTDIEDVRPFLQQARLGLHVSQSETGPLALIEYLSVGLPFVAYQTGEVAKVIATIHPECTVKSFSQEEWVHAINQVRQLTTESYQQQLIRFYDANFGEQQYLEKCLTIYNAIKNDF